MMLVKMNYRILCKICHDYVKTISLGDEMSQEDAMLLRMSVCASCRQAMFKQRCK